MHVETGFCEGTTHEHFLCRALDSRPVCKLIAKRSPDPYVHLN